MTDLLPALFAAPFVLVGVAVAAWFLFAWPGDAARDPYENPDNWGQQ